MEQVVLNGLNIFSVKDRKEFINYIRDKKGILVATNAEKILKADEKLADIINRNIAYPDGIGVVLAMKKKGYDSIKLPGVELWLDIIKEFYKEKTFYFIGASHDVIEKTVSLLKKDFEGIVIKNYRDGFFSKQEFDYIKNDLLEKKPDIVFVAMGSPKQEFIMDELLEVYPALYMGLGGSFDVYSGKVKRAPDIFINMGLEWFYRLIKQPSRIKRQIVLVKFVFYIITNRL